jgi:hypothetical protein
MKNAKIHAIHPNHLRNATALRRSKVQEPPVPRPPRPPASTVRTTAKDLVDPTDYRHPYDSMGRFAKALALRYDARRTRHAYYRQLRLIHQHFNLDPALLTETQLRDYFLFVKLQKHWKPKSIRQALAAARQFFVDLLWNQQLGFHPHIHCLVPGAGLDTLGRFVRVKQPDFLVHLPLLQAAFRRHLHRLFQAHDWEVDPDVWGRNWGVHIQPAGDGGAALKYLGAYVARTAIGDARMVRITEETVTFRWKNRDAGNRTELCTLQGVEFVERYLRHVLPRGLRSIRYYGFCHPSAKVKRLRVQCHAGGPVQLGASLPAFQRPRRSRSVRAVGNRCVCWSVSFRPTVSGGLRRHRLRSLHPSTPDETHHGHFKPGSVTGGPRRNSSKGPPSGPLFDAARPFLRRWWPTGATVGFRTASGRRGALGSPGAGGAFSAVRPLPPRSH